MLGVKRNPDRKMLVQDRKFQIHKKIDFVRLLQQKSDHYWLDQGGKYFWPIPYQRGGVVSKLEKEQISKSTRVLLDTNLCQKRTQNGNYWHFLVKIPNFALWAQSSKMQEFQIGLLLVKLVSFIRDMGVVINIGILSVFYSPDEGGIGP